MEVMPAFALATAGNLLRRLVGVALLRPAFASLRPANKATDGPFAENTLSEVCGSYDSGRGGGT